MLSVWVSYFWGYWPWRCLLSLQYNGTRWQSACGDQGGKKNFLRLKNLTIMSLARNHPPFSQDIPRSLLWALPCGNYFLLKKRASPHGREARNGAACKHWWHPPMLSCYVSQLSLAKWASSIEYRRTISAAWWWGQIVPRNQVCVLSLVTRSWFLERDIAVDFLKCIFLKSSVILYHNNRKKHWHLYIANSFNTLDW